MGGKSDSAFMKVFDSDPNPVDSNVETVDPNVGLSIDEVIKRVIVVSRESLFVESSVEEIIALFNKAIDRSYSSSKKDAKRAHDWCLSEYSGGFRVYRDTFRSADKVCGVRFNCVDRSFFDKKAAIDAGVNLSYSSKLPDLSVYMRLRKVLVTL